MRAHHSPLCRGSKDNLLAGFSASAMCVPGMELSSAALVGRTTNWWAFTRFWPVLGHGFPRVLAHVQILTWSGEEFRVLRWWRITKGGFRLVEMDKSWFCSTQQWVELHKLVKFLKRREALKSWYTTSLNGSGTSPRSGDYLWPFIDQHRCWNENPCC